MPRIQNLERKVICLSSYLKGNLRFYSFMPLIQGLLFYLLKSDKCECLS